MFYSAVFCFFLRPLTKSSCFFILFFSHLPVRNLYPTCNFYFVLNLYSIFRVTPPASASVSWPLGRTSVGSLRPSNPSFHRDDDSTSTILYGLAIRDDTIPPASALRDPVTHSLRKVERNSLSTIFFVRYAFILFAIVML